MLYWLGSLCYLKTQILKQVEDFQLVRFGVLNSASLIQKFFVFVVLQLCCNQLTGSIPTQMGSLKSLNTISLQNNTLNGAIPASLGNLEMLKRLDLSFNSFFGPIPTRLANVQSLEMLDVRNNSLSGVVPPSKSIYFIYIN